MSKRKRIQNYSTGIWLGPIYHPNWSEKECSGVQLHLIACARELSSKFPLLSTDDMYQAGYIGYMEAIKYMTWTIEVSGIHYIKQAIRWAMIKESWKLYGRPDENKGCKGRGKGDAQNRAERFLTVSIDHAELSEGR